MLPEATDRVRRQLLDALAPCTPSERIWYVDADTIIAVCPVCDGSLAVRFAANAPRADLKCHRGWKEHEIVEALRLRAAA